MLINYEKLIKNKTLQNDARFSLLFVTPIAPNFILNFSGFLTNPNVQSKKIQLKQTYIVFTWFYYLTFAAPIRKKSFNFFVLPRQISKSTQIKAPIAHKNWSKEQYEFSYFLIRISFNTVFFNRNLPASANAGLLFALLSKNNLPTFETNTLFLKTFKVFFYLNDATFFNYNFFIKNKQKN